MSFQYLLPCKYILFNFNFILLGNNVYFNNQLVKFLGV